MTERMNIDGIEVEIRQRDLGAGNQGKVHLGVLAADPSVTLVIKEMPDTGDAWVRTQAACDRNISGLSSAFAAPVAADRDGYGQIVHIAPYAIGVSWEDDIARPLPQGLEKWLLQGQHPFWI